MLFKSIPNQKQRLNSRKYIKGETDHSSNSNHMFFTKTTKLSMLIATTVFIIMSCGDACEEITTGSYEYFVSHPGPGISLSGGFTSNARIEKVEELKEDILLFKSRAVVMDGETCVSAFSFSYDLQLSEVLEIKEVEFGCDTFQIWEAEALDVQLNIDSIHTKMTNVSGQLTGTMTDASGGIGINFILTDIPICFK